MSNRGIILAFILVLGIVFLPEVHAATSTVMVGNDSVTLNLRLELLENFTSLPSLNVFFDSSNSSSIADHVQTTIQRLVPGARIDRLELKAKTLQIQASEQMWSLQENYTIVVEGVSKNSGGTIETNLAFLPMNVSDSFKAGSVELNNLGSQYLLSGFNTLPVGGTTYYDSGHPYTVPTVPEFDTGRFNMLDLRWITPVSTWSHTYDPLGSSSTWNLNIASPPFNITIGTQLTPENVFLKVYTAVLNPKVQILGPARAWSQGNTILFDVPSGFDLAMPIIIGISLVVAVSSFVLDRRLSASVRARRKRR